MQRRVLSALGLVLSLGACGGDEEATPANNTITGATTLTVNCDAVGSTTTCTSSFNINGKADPTIELVRGQTYTFNVSVFVAHPFFIKTVRGQASTSNQFTTGVTGAGTATVTFAVPMSAPDELFYQCTNHSSMTGTLKIVNPA